MTKTDHQAFFKKHLALWVCLFLMAATLAVYWQVHGCGFVKYDDTDYVTRNIHVREGITADSLIWAFSAFHAGNWHPVTWLSHMLDCQLFDLHPGPHHLVNLILHILNSLLLFLILKRMTGDLWQSGFVAALFALHPLHVESVAWVSERKDLLCTLFFMLSLWAYTRYARHPSARAYLPVAILFILALMSKPMAVTLPFVLLLLDFWPLNRIEFKPSPGKDVPTGSVTFLRLVWEKTPLFVLAAISSGVTFYAQAHGGAVRSLEFIPLDARIENALVSYAAYIVKMIYPVNLSFLYPYPAAIPGWKVMGACLLLAAITFFAVLSMKQRPWFIVGWLWFLGMLVPVIGVVQVGMQAMADRYSYVPLIGLFIVIAWGAPGLVAKWRHKKICLAASATLILAIFSATTWRQIGFWKNSITLFEHALKVTDDNYIAHYNLGNVLAMQGDADKAVSHYRRAIRINPGFADAYTNLGNALGMQGKTDEAIKQYLQALRIKPDYEGARYNLALALDREGRIEEAVRQYLQVLKINPDHAEAYNRLGIALFKKGDMDGAIAAFQKALSTNPKLTAARNNLNKLLRMKNKM